MYLLVILALTGVISGLISGVYWGGGDGSILGASTGLIFGVATWFITGFVTRVVHEQRINRYFSQEQWSKEYIPQEHTDRDA